MSTRPLRCLLALVLASFCAAAPAQEDVRAVLGACLAQFAEDRTSPKPRFEEISRRCPDLKSDLERSAPAGWLPEYWWGPQLSTGGLADLQDQLVWESLEGSRIPLDTSGVASALASIAEEQKAVSMSWWDRVLEWLRQRAEPKAGEDPTWLFRLLDELTQHEAAIRFTAYGLLALIVLMAVLIVVNELRAAGVFGKRARVASGRQWEGDGPRQGGASLADLERLDLAERPALLLRLLIDALDETRGTRERLGAAATHRELSARVALGSREQRDAFGTLLGCAERVRYASSLPAREDLQRAVTAGRRLLDAFEPGGASGT